METPPVAQIVRGLPEGWFVFTSLGERCESTPAALVVGPGGVFSITQADGEVSSRLCSSAILEARRATRVLRRAAERAVGVRPVLVPNGASVPQRPEISVVRAGDLLPWLRRQPPVLSRETVAALARAAHRPETWA